MKAVVLEAIKQPLVYKDVPTPSPTGREVVVKIDAAALNHRDLYITQGLYARIVTPSILGSDGTGTVVAVGELVDSAWLQKRVLLNPNHAWGDNPNVQSKQYHILGMPTDGTLAEYVKIDVGNLSECPAHLSAEQAAALPLAGLTAYRALVSRANVQAGERVLISGIGGGVALFAMQFALALGAEVWVTSGSATKIEKAIGLGAKGGVNYKDADWAKQLATLAGGFDVIIDSAGGDGFAAFLDLANPAGRIAFYGGTHGSFKINPQKAFWKQLSIFGSTMGNDAEFKSMVELVASHQIAPVVDSVWRMEQANEAFAYMEHSQQFGKIVLKS